MTGSPPEHLGVGEQLPMDIGGQFEREPDGLVVGEQAELELAHGASP